MEVPLVIMIMPEHRHLASYNIPAQRTSLSRHRGHNGSRECGESSFKLYSESNKRHSGVVFPSNFLICGAKGVVPDK